jgi:lipoate-protein ligase A
VKPKIHLLRLKGCTIQRQLEIEEALLRNDQRNWCITQDGVPPAIVLGISGKPERLVEAKNTLPLIKRYTGGGTVVVDHDTAFVSFICQADQLQTPSHTDQIFTWSESFYKHAFVDLPFALRERDYVIHDRKFGGNAQYLAKNRWVHHSTFLWDYNPELMQLLLMPEKRPQYRLERSHDEFLCKLRDYIPNREAFWISIENALTRRFEVVEVNEGEISSFEEKDHRKGTSLLEV